MLDYPSAKEAVITSPLALRRYVMRYTFGLKTVLMRAGHTYIQTAERADGVTQFRSPHMIVG